MNCYLTANSLAASDHISARLSNMEKAHMVPKQGSWLMTGTWSALLEIYFVPRVLASH